MDRWTGGPAGLRIGTQLRSGPAVLGPGWRSLYEVPGYQVPVVVVALHGTMPAEPEARPASKFRKILAPPGTPDGSCRNSASVTYSTTPLPSGATRIAASLGCSPGSFIRSTVFQCG